MDALEARGGKAYAEVVGFGATQSVDRASLGRRPDAEGRAVANAIRAALRWAELEAEAIDAVFPFASAVPEEDAAEIAGLRTVFGERLARCRPCLPAHGWATSARGRGGTTSPSPPKRWPSSNSPGRLDRAADRWCRVRPQSPGPPRPRAGAQRRLRRTAHGCNPQTLVKRAAPSFTGRHTTHRDFDYVGCDAPRTQARLNSHSAAHPRSGRSARRCCRSAARRGSDPPRTAISMPRFFSSPASHAAGLPPRSGCGGSKTTIPLRSASTSRGVKTRQAPRQPLAECVVSDSMRRQTLSSPTSRSTSRLAARPNAPGTFHDPGSKRRASSETRSGTRRSCARRSCSASPRWRGAASRKGPRGSRKSRTPRARASTCARRRRGSPRRRAARRPASPPRSGSHRRRGSPARGARFRRCRAARSRCPEAYCTWEIATSFVSSVTASHTSSTLDAAVLALGDFGAQHAETLEVLPRVAVGGVLHAGGDDVVAALPRQAACDEGEAGRGVGDQGDLVRPAGVDHAGAERLEMLASLVPAAAGVGPRAASRGPGPSLRPPGRSAARRRRG